MQSQSHACRRFYSSILRPLSSTAVLLTVSAATAPFDRSGHTAAAPLLAGLSREQHLGTGQPGAV